MPALQKYLNIAPAVVEEFDKEEQKLNDRRLREAMDPASFKPLMDQIEREPKYAPIVQLRMALKESEQLDEQLKKTNVLRIFTKNLNKKIMHAMGKAL